MSTLKVESLTSRFNRFRTLDTVGCHEVLQTAAVVSVGNLMAMSGKGGVLQVNFQHEHRACFSIVKWRRLLHHTVRKHAVARSFQ